MVMMEDVRVPASRILGGEEGVGKGFNIAMDGINGGGALQPQLFALVEALYLSRATHCAPSLRFS